MFLTVLEGVILALAGNIPVILYAVWSWKLLREHSHEERAYGNGLGRADTWLRIVLWAALVSIIWLFWSYGLGMFAILLTYNLHEEELAMAQLLVTASFLPSTISTWIGELLPQTSKNLGYGLPRGVLLTVFLGAGLVAISIIEWVFIRSSRRRDASST